jgi:hypothetical protein
MGRFPQPECAKGSQKWIQLAINNRPALLDEEILRGFCFNKNYIARVGAPQRIPLGAS